jgi:Toxin co-regulated pilus biosynthesis protein Q
MRNVWAPLLLATATAGAGCAATPPEHYSVVEGTPFGDASQLTVTIADIVSASLPPAATTLSVRRVAGTDSMGISTLLDDSLRERGFALAPSGMDYPGARVVRYSISPIEGHVELALDVDTANATCLFAHDGAGTLSQVGSCTVLSARGLTLKIPRHAMPKAKPPATNGAPLYIAPSGGTWNPPAYPLPARTTPSSPAARPSPLVLPPPYVPPWALTEGLPIRDQIIGWATRAGWRVKWLDENLNWSVPATAVFEGRFDDDKRGPVAQVVRALASEGHPIRVEFFTANHMLLVGPGDRQ